MGLARLASMPSMKNYLIRIDRIPWTPILKYRQTANWRYFNMGIVSVVAYDENLIHQRIRLIYN